MAVLDTADIASLEDEPELVAELRRLRALLEQEDVEGARSFVTDLAARWPGSERVQHYTRVLAPPAVSVRDHRGGRSRRRERAWLRAHAHEYPGCWLAISGDTLIAAHPDLEDVLREVRQALGTERALVFYQPAGAETD